MKQYAGVDVSMEETAVCVIDDDGEVVAEGKVASDPEALAVYLSPWSGSLARVGLEAGGLSPWLYQGLAERGLPCRRMIPARGPHGSTRSP